MSHINLQDTVDKKVQQLIISIGKCYQIIISISITKETLKIILNKQQKWGNEGEKLGLIKTISSKVMQVIVEECSTM